MDKACLKILYDEHITILKMIDILKQNKDHFQKEDISVIVDFFQSYADKCHHGKEEDIFFIELQKKKLSNDLIIILNELIEEHKKARSLVKELSKEKNKDQISKIIDNLTTFYTEHIEKENIRFFPKVLIYFNSQEKKELKAKFDLFDQNIIHKKYLDVIIRLKEKTELK